MAVIVPALKVYYEGKYALLDQGQINIAGQQGG